MARFRRQNGINPRARPRAFIVRVCARARNLRLKKLFGLNEKNADDFAAYKRGSHLRLMETSWITNKLGDK